MNLKSMTDQALLASIKGLVQTEREVLTKVLHHLAEIQKRRLYSALGYSSLFDYAVRHLQYSEGQAGRRTQAMKLLSELPELERKIETGELSLSNISQAQSFFREAAASPKVKPFNKLEKRDVLQRLENKSARDGQKELLALRPEGLALPKERERPLSEDLSEVRLVVTKELKDRLEEVRSLLGPKGATMGLAELVLAMTELSAESLKAKRFGKKRAAAESVADSKPAENVPTPTSEPAQSLPPTYKDPRYIPKAVQYEVWNRDGRACVICRSTVNLNYDHIMPIARGGLSTTDNLRLLCFSCNQRAGIEIFGLRKMKDHAPRHRSPS